ncbi:MAG: DegT/DnrJ/EryC1/StrS family aminotransferase [Desulfofustis sp.]|nr:DegT/DnrJ/EryC1/StrS family aminotransferase [Desulfofustis sp.]NNF45191.1 DegT/DnrJ/EryC1/StrS family aminotransferase [Desulfofustis sp.]NNK58412.1 DegT/DnrJ/EryC1/StrS family aminotransferase [Desulfofustis sp.]
MKVPLLDLGPTLEEQKQEIIDKVVEVVESTRYIQGPEVEAFEEEASDYCGVDGAIGVSSGTDALLVALMALEIGHGDLVLTTPYSFFATMGVILRLGATPVFADIDPVTYNMDPQKMEEVLAGEKTGKIKAIIPVHLYGQCADMSSIMEIAGCHGLPVIEDAAQAIGAETIYSHRNEKGWRKAGSMGFAGCFSFFPSKNLGAIGDGGMVVSGDEEFSHKVRLLRNHGGEPKYYHSMVGGNFRLDPIQAAVLRIKLKRLEQWHRQRRQNASLYNKLFEENTTLASIPVSTPAAVNEELSRKGEEERNYHIYNQYIIRVEKRDELRNWLQQKNIATEIYYPLGLHQQKCLTDIFTPPPMSNTEKAAQETLALPVYPGLTPEMQEYVVKSIAQFYT